MPRAERFSRFANYFAQLSGKPGVFAIAIVSVILWIGSGPFFGFSDTWQLVMNTWTNVVTFLMVFLIQNSQNRDTVALQIKLDELLHTAGGQRSIVGVEHLTQDELEHLRKKLKLGPLALMNDVRFQMPLKRAPADHRNENSILIAQRVPAATHADRPRPPTRAHLRQPARHQP